MTICKITEKYQVWQDGGEYVLTATFRRVQYELCRGSMDACENFMNANPYGVTRIKAESIGRVL